MTPQAELERAVQEHPCASHSPGEAAASQRRWQQGEAPPEHQAQAKAKERDPGGS